MKKKISTIVTIMISLIALYSFIWFANSQLVFSKFITEDFEKPPFSGMNSVTKEVDGFTLLVKKPDYGSFTGNLGITSVDSAISIIIWPHLWKDPLYLLTIKDGEDTIQIEVDENFTPLDKNNLHAQQIISKYADELQKHRMILQNTWALFEDTDNEKN